MTEECEYFRISIYFSFVGNVSVKYEFCAVNNVPYTATFLLIKHWIFSLEVHSWHFCDLTFFFSFVGNVSGKYQLFAVNNIDWTAIFLLMKHCIFELEVHPWGLWFDGRNGSIWAYNFLNKMKNVDLFQFCGECFI